jgi:hypothetical protein
MYTNMRVPECPTPVIKMQRGFIAMFFHLTML